MFYFSQKKNNSNIRKTNRSTKPMQNSVIYHSHYLKLSAEENISFGSSSTIAYCEQSLSPGFIGSNFLLFLNDTLHTFTQAESGCSESSDPRSGNSGLFCPSPDTLVTSGPVA